MPKWMTELIAKGSSVKDCLEVWRQEQEAMRAERESARAEREAVRAEKEAERELEKVRLAHEREERQAKRDCLPCEYAEGMVRERAGGKQ